MLIKNRRQIFYVLLAIIFSSGLLMSLIYFFTQNINRVYYGTDTRLYSIVFGVALAILWPTDNLSKHIETWKRLLMDIIGICAILGLLFMCLGLSGQSNFTYYGGMFIVSFLSTLLVAVCAHPGADVNNILTNPIFHWVGTRSYGIYLYQLPVMVFYEAKINIASHPLINALIESFIIMIISELSYRYIENPLRHFDYSKSGQFIKNLIDPKSIYGFKRLWLLPILFILLIAIFGASSAPNHSINNTAELQKNIYQNQLKMKHINRQIISREKHADANSINVDQTLSHSQKKIKKAYQLSKAQVLLAHNYPITAVGDSILADSSNDLHNVFPNAYISAAVGRQIWQASDVLNHLKHQNELSKNVLINLGTNSPMTNDQINQVLKVIGSKRSVYWVNCHVPTRNWEHQVNSTINNATRTHRNLHVIDWYQYSYNHPKYFWDDQVHPNPLGNRKYVSLIARKIFEYNK